MYSNRIKKSKKVYGNETNKRVLRQEQRWQSILKHEGREAYL